MSPEWDTYFPENVKYDDGWEFLDLEMDLGEWNRTTIHRIRQSSGDYKIAYFIEFYYRNVWVRTAGVGWESDVNHEYVENAARAVLEKLLIAPLTESKP